MSCNISGLIYNDNYKQRGLLPYYYRKHLFDTNLNGKTPSEQYQRLKLIQNTVRVPGSLYIANLGPVTAYKQPITDQTNGLYGVCWNQMSDSPGPSVQKPSIPTGNTSLSKRHTSVTSNKPGCQTPGGVGCDIKHNSYDRYLNRLKGKTVLRRGSVPANFGQEIVFDRSAPVYGGKTIKTNIIDGCICPIGSSISSQNSQIYVDTTISMPLYYGSCDFNTGDYVYAKQNGTQFYKKAQITSISNGSYTILFVDNNATLTTSNINDLKVYFPTYFKFNIGDDVNVIETGNIYYQHATIIDISDEGVYTVVFDNGVEQTVSDPATLRKVLQRRFMNIYGGITIGYGLFANSS